MERLTKLTHKLAKLQKKRAEVDATCTIALDPADVDPALAERAQQLGVQLVWAELSDGQKLVSGLRADGALVDLATAEVIDFGQPDITIDLIQPQ